MKKIKNICILLLALLLIISCSKKEEKTHIVLGTYDDYAPFSYNGRQGGYMLVGFDIELARIIARNYDKELRIEVMPFNDLLTAVETGKVDML